MFKITDKYRSKAMAIRMGKTFLLCLALLVMTGKGLTAQTRAPIVTLAGNNTSSTQIGASIDPLRPKNLTFEIDFIGNGWTEERENAFLYATEIWKGFITSPVRIKIQVSMEDVEGGILARWIPQDPFINFTPRDGVIFEADTWYDHSLADFLAGIDLAPGVPDIVIEFNNNQNWYFGLDASPGSNQYDFVTVALHEIAHGLGLNSSGRTGRLTNGGLGFGIRYGLADGSGNYAPMIYERFLSTPEGEFVTTTYTGGELHGDLFTDYTTTIIWGMGSSAGAQLFTPSIYAEGSSISHLDEFTYNGTTDALMTPIQNRGEAIHAPGALVLGMLNDIGWTEAPITGLEDVLRIHGFDFNCWNNPSCSGDLYELELPIPASVSEGQELAFIYEFIDELPYNQLYPDFSEWQFRALYEGGSYVLNSRSGGSFPWWNFTLNELPNSGQVWLRTSSGQVQGELSFTIEDEYGVVYEEVVSIAIDYPPSDVVLSATVEDAPNCEKLLLEFDAQAADSYTVWYKRSDYSNWTSIVLAPGETSYTFTDLWAFSDYDFRVEAINQHGSQMSEVYTREACTDLFDMYPLPASVNVFIETPMILPIQQIDIYRTDAPVLVRSIEVNGITNLVNVPVFDVVAGTYLVRVSVMGHPAQGKLITVQ